ncbi:hypothetical protein [Ideonella sp.]|uniref:hypothetical protein n=1 Tax=Ideonella sp. TaxID=1929293 RepID=UPI0035B181AE
MPARARSQKLALLLMISASHVGLLYLLRQAITTKTAPKAPERTIAYLSLPLERAHASPGAIHRRPVPHRSSPSSSAITLFRPSIDSPASLAAGPSESGPASPEPTAPAASAPPPALDLSLPARPARAYRPTPAELALHDPRANTLRLSRSERFGMAMGEYECIFERLEPDGSLTRGPGHRAAVPGLSPNAHTGKPVMECVP